MISILLVTLTLLFNFSVEHHFSNKLIWKDDVYIWSIAEYYELQYIHKNSFKIYFYFFIYCRIKQKIKH